MDKVKVLVAHFLGEEKDAGPIKAVSPRVEVMYHPYVAGEGKKYLNSLGSDRPTQAKDKGLDQFMVKLAQAEIVLCLDLPRNVVDVAPRLKWVHSMGAGVDKLADMGILEKGIILTNSSGINAAPIAEFVMGAMVIHAKNILGRFKAQTERRWARLPNAELAGKALGIVGTGRIGTEVAQRAAAFKMRVLGVRRSWAPGMKLPNFDAVYPTEKLHEALAQCDYVVVSVSLTPETEKMIGEKEFRAMKPTAFFINVARGRVVDEAALTLALKSGRLGGAALDVFEKEPLPKESELWALPNVMVTAHNAGGLGPVHVQRATELFCDNLRRYLEGQPLMNVVEKGRAY